MAEVQTTTESGEMARRFIELVMMQAQNAAFALGQIPHPETGEAPVNLELARLFIDQLHVLRSKTQGNLSEDESSVLNNAISNLQMAFVEVSQQEGAPSSTPSEPAAQPGPSAEPPPPAASAPADAEGDSKKKFSKSYGS